MERLIEISQIYLLAGSISMRTIALAVSQLASPSPRKTDRKQEVTTPEVRGNDLLWIDIFKSRQLMDLVQQDLLLLLFRVAPGPRIKRKIMKAPSTRILPRYHRQFQPPS